MVANGLNVMLGHRYSHEIAHRLGWGSVLLSFLCALWVFGQTLGHPEPRTVIAYRWFFGGALSVNRVFLIDPLTCVMMRVVTCVGFLIHVYSVGYMHGEEGFTRIFAYMNLFMVSMLLLVMGNNYAVLFIGWEGVGLCSYLLICYYCDRVSAAKAATKAFVVNRIGDAGFLIAIFLVFARFGTLDYTEVFAKADTLDSTTAFAIAVCLLIGAVGKSAQLPLYTWLPDAMEGPTPVSALIHAATMVTAGVYMVVRNHAIYDLAPNALVLVGVIGGATALFAATVGLVPTDIKRVLAYSTVSQLGFMFLACGVGAYAAAIFHLVTHAFFKALLFLAAGSVIHALSGEQDIRKMGGLWNKVPATHWVFLIATFAISGIVPLSGFFSKDEILWAAWVRSPLLWVVGVGTAGLTAFYMARLWTLVFLGKGRFDEETRHHLHESPRTMTVPLVLLAILSAVGGFLGVPEVLRLPNFLERYLAPVFHTGRETVAHAPGLEILLMLVSLVVALFALAFGWACYARWPEIPERFTDNTRGLYRLIVNTYFVDELYDRIVLRPYAALCRWAAWFDRW